MENQKSSNSIFPHEINNFTLYMKILQESRGSIRKIKPKFTFFIFRCKNPLSIVHINRFIIMGNANSKEKFSF